MLGPYMTGRLVDLWFAGNTGACDPTCQSAIDTRKTAPGLRMLEKHAVVRGAAARRRPGSDKDV